MAIVSACRYSVDVILILKDENITLQRESISAITIDSNYDIYNRPIIYLTLNLQSKIYNKLVLNRETGIINLRVKKFSTSNTSLGKDYIHDNFSYIIKADPDYYRDLRDKLKTEDGSEEDQYLSGTIALIRKDSIDNIKRLHYGIIKNSNMASIIHKYTKNRTMIIEPFDSIEKFDTLIIPPMESLVDLLTFLNKYDAFYDRKYRYFEDFNTTYLLSSSGKPIHGFDEYDTMIIDIVDLTDERSKTAGITIDHDSKSYILYVDAQDTRMEDDITKNMEYDTIIGVTSSGDIYKVPITKDSNNEKIMVQRIYNDNERYIDNLKHEINSISKVLQVNKSEVDGSLFTPNKEYLVNSYKEMKQYDGRFILSFKKEVIIQQDTEFISSILLGLRKVEE